MAEETREERFKRVAEKRVQNIINGLRSLSQMANRRVYHWNNDQLKTIWAAIEKEIGNCKKSFEDPDSMVFRL
jgi:DNA repair photolyase